MTHLLGHPLHGATQPLVWSMWCKSASWAHFISCFQCVWMMCEDTKASTLLPPNLSHHCSLCEIMCLGSRCWKYGAQRSVCFLQFSAKLSCVYYPPQYEREETTSAATHATIRWQVPVNILHFHFDSCRWAYNLFITIVKALYAGCFGGTSQIAAGCSCYWMLWSGIMCFSAVYGFSQCN